MNWIKCSERLPEVGKQVLVLGCVSQYFLGYRDSDDDWCLANAGQCFFKNGVIDYWMPLPPLPEGE